jgi:hypothetical protein
MGIGCMHVGGQNEKVYTDLSGKYPKAGEVI